MIRRHINHAPLLLALLLALAGVSRQAWADFDDGMRAYLHHQDYATALQEWRPLAEQGDPRAQSMLGVMYHFGQGVPRDYTEAAQWYRRAADQGNAKAQHNLGVLYANGEGVPQNDAIAVQWFRKAAEQGNAGAQVALGSR